MKVDIRSKPDAEHYSRDVKLYNLDKELPISDRGFCIRRVGSYRKAGERFRPFSGAFIWHTQVHIYQGISVYLPKADDGLDLRLRGEEGKGTALYWSFRRAGWVS